MKTALAVIGQLLLLLVFLAVFGGGSFLNLVHADPFGAPRWFVSHPTPTSTRFFVPSGLFLMTILFLVVLGIEAAAKRLRTAGKWTAVVFVVALLLGFLSKFGFVTTNVF